MAGWKKEEPASEPDLKPAEWKPITQRLVLYNFYKVIRHAGYNRERWAGLKHDKESSWSVQEWRVMLSGKQPHRRLWGLEGAVLGNPFTQETPKISPKS